MKKVSLIFSVIIIVLLSACASQQMKKDVDYKLSAVRVEDLDNLLLEKLDFDYTDLDLTIEEFMVIEKYQQTPLEASVTDWGYYYHTVNVDGLEFKVGIDHYIYEQLKKIFKIKINVMEYEYFEDVVDSVYDGSSHFTAGMYHDDTRRENGIYSNHYIKEQVFVYSNNLIIKEPKDFLGLTTGKVKESAFLPSVKKLFDDNYVDYNFEYDKFEELFNALELTEIDFIVLPYNDELIKKGFESVNITNILKSDIETTNSYLFGRKNDKELEILFKAFNKAFDYGIRKNICLYQSKYENALLLNGDYFTDEEKNFIESTNNKPVKLKLNSDLRPYTFYDNKKGQWSGQALDIFSTVSEISGIKYEIINKEGYPFNNILNELSKDDFESSIDGTLGLAVSKDREEYLEFTDSTYVSRMVVVGESTSDEILYLSDLYNSKVGDVAGYYSMDLIYNNLPNINLEEYQSTEELVIALKSGEIDYFISFDTEFNELYYDDQEYSLEIKYVSPENVFFANGFAKDSSDSKVIVSIYNKILPLVHVGKINQHYFGNKVDLSKVIYKRELFLNVTIAISVALLVISMIVWKSMLRFKEKSLIDGLTGIKNRNSFNKLLSKGVFTNKSIVFIDVDDFKDVNTLYGHGAGDFILKELSNRLSEFTVNNELYRIGGDEFLLISNDLDVNDFQKALNCTIEYEKAQLKIHSTGAVVRYDDFKDLGFEELINILSFSVLNGKKNGKNLVVEIDDMIIQRYNLQKSIEENLFKAMKFNEFIPYFQPFIDVNTKKIIGGEVLARWCHDKVVYSPAVFHDLAEASGIIYDIDLLMFEESLKLLCELKCNNLVSDDFELSSNFSPYTLDRLELDILDDLVSKYKVNKESICIEVTEQLLLDRTGFYKVIELDNRGFKIAIDDFSAGHSSLVYLMDLNFKYLKIDRLLLSKVDSDEINENYIVYEAICNLSKKLGIVVISEGVETEKHEKVLIDLGVNHAQGFHYSKPMNKEDFIKYVEKKS